MTPDRLVLISTDGHCGAALRDYKPYLELRYHEEFDAWARTYHDPWEDIDADLVIHPDLRIGVASFDSPLNWDSAKRLKFMESQGVVGEVLFPNTTPPFSPSGVITAAGPLDDNEFKLRSAGLRAHNRWLADFCADAPGRRAGFAQIFLNDVDLAIAEVQRACESGLRGVLLPTDHVLKMVNLYYPRFDPLWEVCADLGMPIHRHGGRPTEEPAVGGPGSRWVGLIEGQYYPQRIIPHLICAGVFERFPKLKLVVTELKSSIGVLALLEQLDSMYRAVLEDRMFSGIPYDEGVAMLSRSPSEYFATNCFVGGPLDHREAHKAGVPNLMFGADVPHAEGTAPFNLKAVRAIFDGVPEDDLRREAGLLAADVYGFDVRALQKVANRIGPTIGEAMTPLTDEERPVFPGETRSACFRRA
jgi:predicted TIM-barrel fold metal-dependent hydrolase